MIIYKKTFHGGSGLTPKRGQASPNTLARALRDVADDLTQLRNAGTTALRSGGVVASQLLADPGTGNAQVTGTGNTTWNINVGAHDCIVGGLKKVFAAQVDISIHAGTFLAGFINGASCLAALVDKNVSGTISTVAVKGTPATTGDQVAPTDAEIQAAVGAANSWVKVGETLLNRTGDITVTESHDNVVMENYVHRSGSQLTTKG